MQFASFWFDVEPNDVSELELLAHELGVDAQAEHGELHEPTESRRYGHRDFRFVTCCSRFGGIFYHTVDEHRRSAGYQNGSQLLPILARTHE